MVHLRHCSVRGCPENKETNPDRRFFPYPAEIKRRKEWAKAAGWEDPKLKAMTSMSRFFICDLHFEATDFKKKHMLYRSAVPTLRLPKEVSQERPDNDVWESFMAAPFRSVDVDTNICKIIRIKRRSNYYFGDREYDEGFLVYAMNLYFNTPGAYSVMSETLGLPSVKTLKKHVSLSLSTDFDSFAVQCLKAKIRDFTNEQKYCVVCAEEIKLRKHLYYRANEDKVIGFQEINKMQKKEIASLAVVVMARGVLSDWKQPLAYCLLRDNEVFCHGLIQLWLENIIATLIEIGFNVLAYTSAHNACYNPFIQPQSVLTDKPYFLVKGKKIYYIFDIPILMNSMRNYLINFDFIYNDPTGLQFMASWDHIVEMYNIDNTKSFKLANKLNDSHIRPNGSEKTRVKYAAQIFSRTVAATISRLVETSELPEISIGTAKFVEIVNDTFDILNSSPKNDFEYKNASNHQNDQIRTLEKMKNILLGLQVVKDGKEVANPTFVEAFLISINAIIHLTYELTDAGYHSMFMRRLNQEDLTNFSENLRQKCNNIEPSPIKFYLELKRFYTSNMLKLLGKHIYHRDLNHLMINLERTKPIFSSRKGWKALDVGTTDYRFGLSAEIDFNYLCKYLLYKCIEYHNYCEILQTYAKSTDHPPDDFKHYIREVNRAFENHLNSYSFYHLGSEVLASLNEINYEVPCKGFPIDYLNKLFIRFRIFNLIKLNNVIIMGNDNVNQNCFYLDHLLCD